MNDRTQINYFPVEIFDPQTESFTAISTARIVKQDAFLLDMARYVAGRVEAKERIGMSTAKESALLAQIRARLGGGEG